MGGSQAEGDEAAAAFSGYSSWEQIDPYVGIQPGESVHGSYVQIWYNATAAETINAAAGARSTGRSLIGQCSTAAAAP